MRPPDILLVIADRLAGTLFRDGPAGWLQAPALARLAEGARLFARTYTASPLGAPARASLMTGSLPAHTLVYDDGAEFAASLPTITHHLRRAGYRTALAGRSRFVGPDRHHGFELRLGRDLGPAGFERTPLWGRDGGAGTLPAPLTAVAAAGPVEMNERIAFDAEAARAAVAAIEDFARDPDRPFFLALGLAHPGPLFQAETRHWDAVPKGPHLAPTAGPLPPDELPPHARRLHAALGLDGGAPDAAAVARARQGYFAAIGQLDATLGMVLAALEATGRRAFVLVTADHGELLGERGLWGAMSFREGAARVPLILAGPGVEPGRETRPVSLLDVAPTLAEVAGLDAPRCDGTSLFASERGPVPMEYAGDAAPAPMVALVEECWKYVVCPEDPPQLFDLVDDPHEATNLAGLAPGEESRRAAEVDARWDLAAYDRVVRLSQSRRRLVHAALSLGARVAWDHGAGPEQGPGGQGALR